MSTVCQKLAAFSAKVTYADLPEVVVDSVQRLVFDSVGCAFGGVRTRDYAVADQVDRELGGEPQCRIIGSGRMANVTSATFMNSLAVRVLDCNDFYGGEEPCHPSGLIPGVWACAELVDATGEEVVLAIALAYELEMRLCEVAAPGLRDRGWHNATLTAFASAWACAKTLGLDETQTAHAIGIAGSYSGTLGCVSHGEPSLMKSLADPLATQAGASGALFARAGSDGPEDVFGGVHGLSNALGGDADFARLTQGLGESWRISKSRIRLKMNELDVPAGDSGDPTTEAQRGAKFDAMCGDEVPESQRAEIREAVAQLPQVPARRFLELLAFRG